MQFFTVNLDGTEPGIIIDDARHVRTNKELMDMTLAFSSEGEGKYVVAGENLGDDNTDRIFHIIAANGFLINSNLSIFESLDSPDPGPIDR